MYLNEIRKPRKGVWLWKDQRIQEQYVHVKAYRGLDSRELDSGSVCRI